MARSNDHNFIYWLRHCVTGGDNSWCRSSSFAILPGKIYVIEREQTPPSLSNQDIDQILFHQQSPVGYAQSPSTLLEFHRVKAHQVQFVTVSLALYRQASMEQILRASIWRCHNTFTDIYLKDLFIYSSDLIHLIAKCEEGVSRITSRDINRGWDGGSTFAYFFGEQLWHNPSVLHLVKQRSQVSMLFVNTYFNSKHIEFNVLTIP